MATMRAVVCPEAPVPPTGLVYTAAHPKPAPKEGHVLIRVRAFGLNRSELFTRQGHSPGIAFPRVLGIECVGEVQDAGGSARWKAGDKVAAIMGGMGRQFDGGYAEYTLVPQSCVSPPIDLPPSIDWAKFAAIPETYMTAWGTLKASLNLQPLDTLLIRGGTTSVGLAAAALARSSLFGCARVIATTRSAGKEGALRASGVSDVVVDDSGSVAEKVKALTGGRGADKAIELVGGPTLTDTCLALAANGVASVVGCVSGEWTVKEFYPFEALAPSKHLTFFGSNAVDMSSAPVQWIVNALDKGELKTSIDKVFKMEQAGEAHAYMESNAAAGKVVCVVD
ncbi:GroES-like protein [Coniophora puteana RWD-64-598 SS2]|uniref:GroES-like protein n=1 Tax=Coniophora puteana (strain RWD-64-598) TaxID=741705 RepID=A0A5M3MZE4_CONPW|nr:GroES-like protein [Coniophora puteana RWD-64-598 SS2]EIW84005.1 GroES-like protein [Coniophora puteana RWD-64-598 SS2]